jgi:hypothetical protein
MAATMKLAAVTKQQRLFWRRLRNHNGEPAEKNIKWKRQDKEVVLKDDFRKEFMFGSE